MSKSRRDATLFYLLLVAAVSSAWINFRLPYLVLLFGVLTWASMEAGQGRLAQLPRLLRWGFFGGLAIAASNTILYKVETHRLSQVEGPFYAAAYSGDTSLLMQVDSIAYRGGIIGISQGRTGAEHATVLWYRDSTGSLRWVSRLRNITGASGREEAIDDPDLIEVREGVVRDRLSFWHSEGSGCIHIWKRGGVSRVYFGW